ncbi:MAG: hypothetical protein ABUS57_06705 [Pseudomonadota bacterium]
MAEMLTYRGRLGARAYNAIERLQSVSVRVIPATTALAGWCDQMARKWPVDAVFAENGGLYIEAGRMGGAPIINLPAFRFAKGGVY